MNADPRAPTIAHTATPAAPATPDALLDHPRYRILELLGAGGMGAVYKAEHLLMERTVALKIINPDLVKDPGAVERFRREVKAAAKLTHPNIVTAHDADHAGGAHFLVMEYVEGTNLARLVAEQGPLPIERACDYVRQAALGLQHAHELGMVHRDIKPHNLMLTPGGQVKVLDFGLARFAQESQPAGVAPQTASAPADSLTQVGAVMGTPDYIAPEQVQNPHGADIRADIYSLGCTLYDLLAGHPPFPEGTVVEKATAHVERAPRPLREVRSEVSAELAEVVAQMMAKDPVERYQTPAEVAAALLPFTDTAPPPPRRTRPWLLAGLAAIALLLTAGAVYLLWPVKPLDDMQRMQGAWKPVAGEFYGGPMNEATLKTFSVNHIQGDRVVWVMTDGQVVKGTFRLDAGKSPREIDVTRDGERVTHGIYRLEGDTLTLCISQAGQPRPADFKTDPQGKISLVVMKRIPGHVDLPSPPPEESIRRFVGHQSGVKSVAFSPDGVYALSGSGYRDGLDCSMRLWEVATGKEVRRYERHVSYVQSVAFSPGDGRLVASGSADQTLRVFDRETAREVQRFTTPDQTFVNAIAFAPDGQHIFSGGDGDCFARLWDIKTGKEVQQFKGHRGWVTALAVSPDGRWLLTGSQDTTARLWEPATGKPVHLLEGQGSLIEGAAFSPDSGLAVTCGGEAVLLWDVATGKEVRRFKGHVGKVMGAALSPDGGRLLTAGTDMTVRLWEVGTGKELAKLRGHTGPVWSVTFSPDGKQALSGSADKTLRLWALPDAAGGRP